MKLRYLSLFSGIEAASVAWMPLGWECVAVAEIEKFPRNGGSACLLSEILETGKTDRRFYLSAKACKGILRRAEKSGKNLPPILLLALKQVAEAQRTGETRGQDPIIAELIPIQEIGKRQTGTPMNGTGHGKAGDPMYTLQSNSVHGVAYAIEIEGDELAFALRSNGSHSGDKGDDGINTTMVCEITGTLGSHHKNIQLDQTFILEPISFNHQAGGSQAMISPRSTHTDALTKNQTIAIVIPEVCGALNDGAHMGGGQNGQDVYTGRIIPVADQSGRFFRLEVRRLTTVECCRLQGFDDAFLDIMFNKKPAKDSPKYKAIGNSMATPVMQWIGKQIEKTLEYEQRIT